MKLINKVLSGVLALNMTCLPVLAYDDVTGENENFEGIMYCQSKAYMTGYEDGNFHPDDPLSRGMLATILYRMYNKPQTVPSIFKDVSDWSFYKDASDWMSSVGLMTGNGTGAQKTFDGDDPIRRQDLALVLYRLAGQPVVARNAANDLAENHYASKAVDWALENKIINPIGTGFAAGQSGTRGVTANALYRFGDQDLLDSLVNTILTYYKNWGGTGAAWPGYPAKRAWNLYFVNNGTFTVRHHDNTRSQGTWVIGPVTHRVKAMQGATRDHYYFDMTWPEYTVDGQSFKNVVIHCDLYQTLAMGPALDVTFTDPDVGKLLTINGTGLSFFGNMSDV